MKKYFFPAVSIILVLLFSLQFFRPQIAGSFANTALYIDWITYATWHEKLKAITQIVELALTLLFLYHDKPVALAKHSIQANNLFSSCKPRQIIRYLNNGDGNN